MSENQSKKTTDREYYLFAFRIMGDFGVTIAVPVVLFVLIGQYLDGKYNTRPWFMVVGFLMAGLLTAKLIHKKAKRYGKEYQAMEDKGKK
jgi:F0F1-type ATP synthase assembly protein I